MKVLHVIDSLGVGGGAEHALAGLLPELRLRGVESSVVCLIPREGGIEQALRAQGFEVDVIGSRPLAAQARLLNRIIRDQAPDVVHATLWQACLVSRLACLRQPVALINSLVNTSYDPVRSEELDIQAWKLRGVRLLDRWSLRARTDRVHALTETVRNEVVDDLGYPASQVSVIPRGRSSDALGRKTVSRRRDVRRSLAISDDAFVVLTAGRQDRQKAQDVLVRAFASVNQEFPDSILLLAGRPGDASEQLKQAITDVDLGESIRVLGHRDDISDLLAASDVFAFPSMYEGLGSVLIEAMALEAPIVASDAPAIVEVLEGGVVGRLVARGDSSALAQALLDLANSAQTRKSYAEIGRQRFEECFELTSIADRTLEMYRSALERQTEG